MVRTSGLFEANPSSCNTTAGRRPCCSWPPVSGYSTCPTSPGRMAAPVLLLPLVDHRPRLVTEFLPRLELSPLFGGKFERRGGHLDRRPLREAGTGLEHDHAVSHNAADGSCAFAHDRPLLVQLP